MEKASSSSSYSSSSMASSSSDQTSYLMTSSILSRTSSSSSSAVGDYLGTESCFDVLSADEENDMVSGSVSEPDQPLSRLRLYGGRRRAEREARAKAAREFPPPIPLLAQTENLHPHMPWVLKRVVTSDGRLILREEKVHHHEYFRAHRSNGRLTLHLVPLDDDFFQLPRVHKEEDDVEEVEEEEEEEEEDECDDDHEVVGDLDGLADNVSKSVNVTDPNDVFDNVTKGIVVTSTNDDDDAKGNVECGSEDAYRKVILAAVAAEETVVESGVMVGGGGSPRGKCFKSCFVGLRVQEIRPVLS